jgi:curved DNA-binding protein CbpA
MNPETQADFELRKKKRPDYYEILLVSKIATEGEIKNAYKARVMHCISN